MAKMYCDISSISFVKLLYKLALAAFIMRTQKIFTKKVPCEKCMG